jgi:hypothetical protein
LLTLVRALSTSHLRPDLVLLRPLQHGQALVQDPQPGVPHRQPLPSGLDPWLVRSAARS